MTLLPIFLPHGASLKVAVDDNVTAGQVIAQSSGKKTDQVIHVSKELSAPADKTLQYLKKHLGDAILVGDLIAVKKGTLGLGSKKVISKISGTVVKIDEQIGDIYVRTQNEEKVESIISPVEGSVDFCDNNKIVIKTDKHAFIAEDALGKDGKGEAIHIEELELGKINSDIEGKVVLVRLLDKVSLFKIIGLDATGIVTEEFKELDFIDLNEKKIRIPVVNVTDEDFKKLVKLSGRIFLLNGENKSIIVL